MIQKEFNHVINQINLSEADKNRILRDCKKHKHADNQLFVYSGRIAAALGIALLSATSLTAYAAVNAYQAYMEQMSTQEVQERYHNLHEGLKEGDSFSRTLSDKERERMSKLRSEYEQGLRFPTVSMYCFDGSASSKPADQTIAYDYVNMIFYIPEKELTDEELLQIIDVWEKGNYSLNAINNEAAADSALSDAALSDEEIIAQAKAEMEKHSKDVPITDEERMKQSAEATVSAVCGRDISNMTWSIVLYGDTAPRYLVDIEDASRKYTVVYTSESTPDNLKVYRYRDADLTISEPPKTAGYTHEQIMEQLPHFAADAQTTLSENFGISTKVTKCEYAYDQTVLDGIGSGVTISLTTEDGNRYKFDYSLQESILREMLTYDAGKYDDVDFITWCDFYGTLE